MTNVARYAAICIVLTAAHSVHAQGSGVLLSVHTAAMEVTHGKPYVMVMVNGRGPFRFIIDTGTGGDAIVTTELASQLELPVAGEAHLNDPTGKGGQSAPLRRIDSLQVAGVDFYAIKAVEHTLPSGDGDCQGMLGFTLFRDFLFTLDYVNGRLTLADGELEPDGERSVLPFRMPDGVPIARLIIAGREVDAQIDSGGAGLSLPEPLTASLKFETGPAIFAKGQSLSTRFVVKAGKLATDVRLGEFTLADPWVEINPAFPIANFGSCPMQHFIISFDQQNLLMRLDGPHKRITLGVTPTPLRLATQPIAKPDDLALVPIG
jgi:hypothetical protein